MLKTVADCTNAALYAMIYGDEGSGKTRLIASLSEKPGGSDLGIITADESGPTSLLDSGHSKAHVWVLPGPDADPFEPALRGIREFRRNKAIRTIGIDACTVISANAVQFKSGGQGGKSLGFEGWQAILSGFLRIEAEAQKAVRSGINVIYTAWAQPARVVTTVGGDDIEAPGRPWIHGQGKTWLPGKTDLIGRLTSRFQREKWIGKLQVHASEEWLAKTRWKLPNPAPADLKELRKMVLTRRAAATKAPMKLGSLKK